MDAENELNNQPVPATEAHTDVPNKSSTLYQSILAEPLLTTVLCYAACLVTAVKALAYLKQNYLLTDEVLRIGFSDRTLGSQLPSPRSKPGQALRSQLQTVGILKHSGHETFRGMVTVPLLSTSGTVTGIYALCSVLNAFRHQRKRNLEPPGSAVANDHVLNAFRHQRKRN